MMKKIILMKNVLMVCFLTALLSTSCLSNDSSGMGGGVYGTIGTYEKQSNQPYFMLDDSLTMVTTNQLSIADSLIGDRFFLDFQKVQPQDEDPNYNYTVNLLNIQRVVTKPILVVDTKSQLDSMGVDAIIPSWVWCSSHYINIVYYIKGSNGRPHMVNLIENLYQPIKASGDTLVFELKHNDYNDYPYQELRGVSSFDLTPYMEQSKDSVLKMQIYYMSYYQGLSNLYLVYDMKKQEVVDFNTEIKNTKRMSEAIREPATLIW